MIWNLFSGAVIGGVFLLHMTFAAGADQTESSLPVSVICYSKQFTWIHSAGDVYEISQPVKKLIQTNGELTDTLPVEAREPMDVQELLHRANRYFDDETYDIILAFPAAYSLRERLRALQFLGGGATRVRISTVSEIAALGYNHYHLELDKRKEQTESRMFVVVDGEQLSITLADVGYLGVVLVEGSVGLQPTTSPPDKAAYSEAVFRGVTQLARMTNVRGQPYEQIVITGHNDVAGLFEAMKADRPAGVRISGYSKLVVKGLLTQAAMLRGSQDVKNDLLLVATPHTSVGVILPVDSESTHLTRVSFAALTLPDSPAVGAELDGPLKRDSEVPKAAIKLSAIPQAKIVPKASFLEVLPAFTTIPQEMKVSVIVREQPSYVIVAEHSGTTVLPIQRIPWAKEFEVMPNGSLFEFVFDIDANMATTVAIRDAKTGKSSTHKLVFGAKVDAVKAVPRERRPVEMAR